MSEVKYFTKNRKLITGDIGLELEIEPKEGKTLPIINNTVWMTVNEDSLRYGGKEYITTQPLLHDGNYLKNIDKLTKNFNPSEVNVDTFRTSTHVHLNMTQKQMVQVWTIVVAYWLIENLLFKYCGEDREGNHFCLRLKDAEGVINVLNRALNYENPFMDFNNNIRYGGLNLNALYKFGSLEFRGMRGTINCREIECWSTALYEMSELAISFFKNPQELMDFYYNNGIDPLIDLLFPNKLNLFLKGITNREKLVKENAYKLIGIAYKFNWNNYNNTIQKRVKELEKKLNKQKPAQSPTVSSYLTYEQAVALDF